MATGPGFPSATNVWIPNLDASGNLIVAFSRNAKKFPIMNYMQLIESPKMQGYYKRLGTQEQGRVGVNVNDDIWNFGAERPQHNDGLEYFTNVPFVTKRFDYGFNLDDDTERQADWDVALQHSDIHTTRAVTNRTIRSLSVLTTAANWETTADSEISANHTDTATSLAGGYLDAGTSTNPYLKKALDKAAVLIMKDSMGVIEPEMLQVVCNPNTARLIAEGAEIHDYIKGSPAAIDEIRSASSPNARYGPGLPSQVYGYNWIVDNTVKVTTRKNASNTATKTFAFPDETIAIVARVGELEGKYGGPAFSTLSYFWYRDELTIERFTDPRSRRMEYHVVDCGVPILTSPLSGFLITAATSVAS